MNLREQLGQLTKQTTTIEREAERITKPKWDLTEDRNVVQIDGSASDVKVHRPCCGIDLHLNLTFIEEEIIDVDMPAQLITSIQCVRCPAGHFEDGIRVYLDIANLKFKSTGRRSIT